MEYRPIARPANAFQQPPTAAEIQAMCHRILGTKARIASATELGNGMYNSTFRIDVHNGEPVILRVAPEPEKQFSSERELMRNEYASFPYLSSLSSLMPKLVGADFTHDVINRDYLIQSFLEGKPVPEHLDNYPRSSWPHMFRQLGSVTKTVHDVRGQYFGRVAGPWYSTWSEAVLAGLTAVADDLRAASLSSPEIHRAIELAKHHRDILDHITDPRLLTGDLWTINVMLSEAAPVPTITGVFDFDRTLWGDPAADWPIRMAQAKPGTERDAFWETYGPLDRSPDALLRQEIYKAWHQGSIHLEHHRLGKIKVNVS